MLEDDERESLKQLTVFMAAVAENPRRFLPTGRMAASLKKAARRHAGPAQPQTRKNKRKVRQERRRSFAILRRRQRREIVEAFNAAQEEIRVSREDYEAKVRALDAEVKFDVVDINGNVVIAGIPKSMIKAQVEYEPTPLDAVTSGSGIVLPGNVEKRIERAMEEEEREILDKLAAE